MVRLVAFISALIAYALFSAPTPDHISIAEFFVMAGLFVTIGVSGVMQAIDAYTEESAPSWLLPARLLLVFGLSIPLLTALVNGHGLPLILRDIIPFLFLLLPLFLPFNFGGQERLRQIFPYLLCLMGLVFAVRVMGNFFFHAGSGQFLPGFIPDPGNLVNAPTVLFAALFLTGVGGLTLIYAAKVQSVFAVLGCFALALVLLAAMAGIGQRAHIGAWALVVLFWIMLLACKRPLALGRLSLVVLAAGLLAWPLAADIAQGLAQKTSMVGLNNRIEEARTVWESFHDRPAALIFGQGWGATIVSPAVGPNPVNYTHSLITTYLLKTGLLGLALVLLYLGALGCGIWRILWVHPVAALAVAAPFFIDIFLYASFKSLDFGLLLTLIALWTRWPPAARESCQKDPGWCMQDGNPFSGKTGL